MCTTCEFEGGCGTYAPFMFPKFYFYSHRDFSLPLKRVQTKKSYGVNQRSGLCHVQSEDDNVSSLYLFHTCICILHVSLKSNPTLIPML